MDSYALSLQKNQSNFALGIASGLDERELEEEEEIDIVKPQTFDPQHPGLINLSPNQVADLRRLADKRDNDELMSIDEIRYLDDLLNLLENGIPVDERHPGMVNLTPEQQRLFAALNH